MENGSSQPASNAVARVIRSFTNPYTKLAADDVYVQTLIPDPKLQKPIGVVNGAYQQSETDGFVLNPIAYLGFPVVNKQQRVNPTVFTFDGNGLVDGAAGVINKNIVTATAIIGWMLMVNRNNLLGAPFTVNVGTPTVGAAYGMSLVAKDEMTASRYFVPNPAGANNITITPGAPVVVAPNSTTTYGAVAGDPYPTWANIAADLQLTGLNAKVQAWPISNDMLVNDILINLLMEDVADVLSEFTKRWFEQAVGM